MVQLHWRVRFLIYGSILKSSGELGGQWISGLYEFFQQAAGMVYYKILMLRLVSLFLLYCPAS